MSVDKQEQSAAAQYDTLAQPRSDIGSAAVRSLAFYLPQFHPVPENDAWWGKGFTEWRHVVKATPQFDGHYQPRLPADLGFYDLRVPEVQEAQANLAATHNIDGFVYYHYWFHGRRLLKQPLEAMLANRSIKLPFAVCWANESWSNKLGPSEGIKSRDKTSDITLIEQTYSRSDDAAHFVHLAKLFEDDRYITVNGRPLVLIYRAHALPNALRTTDTWRKSAQKLGYAGLYLCAVQNAFFENELQDPTKIGFDAAIEFQPDGRRRVEMAPGPTGATTQKVYDYKTSIELSLDQDPVPYKRYPGVMPNWDNTARRRQGATIYVNSSPAVYGEWVLRTLIHNPPFSVEENLLFINSWNEWSEGSNLEPDERWGMAYLEAHRDAITKYNNLRNGDSNG